MPPQPTCVVLIGIPASGKSSFFKARFADSHVRINRDMLGTAHRVALLRAACLQGGVSFVLDNTNVTRGERRDHIEAARSAGFRVEGFFLQSRRAECSARNRAREPHQRLPDAAIGGMSGRLELPSRDEGFDALYFVRLGPEHTYEVEEWRP